MLSDADLLKKVTYTASLATKPQDIDVLLDQVRAITARTTGAELQLKTQDRTVLLDVQKKLERYLVKRETIRLFTDDSLQVQIEQHLRGAVNKHSFVQLLVAVGISLLAGATMAALPILPDRPLHGQLTGGVVFSLLHIGAASLFLTALPAFHSSLRKSFKVICLGIVFLAANILLVAVLTGLEVIYRGGIALLVSTLFFLIGGMLYYGMRGYAKLSGERGVYLSLRLPLFICIGATIISFTMQHTALNMPEIIFDISAIEHGTTAGFSFLGYKLVAGIGRHSAEVYRPSVKALAAACVAALMVSLYVYGIRLWFGVAPEGPWGLMVAVLLTCQGIAFVRAGYLFNKVSRY